MSSNHYNLATSGVRAGHKTIAKLGYSYFIQIIITPLASSGGGGGNYTSTIEKRFPYNPLFGVIHIEFEERVENFLFYDIARDHAVQVEVNLLRYAIDQNEAIIDVRLESTISQIVASPTITVKGIHYDSIKRIEQTRIFVKYPKFNQ